MQISGKKSHLLNQNDMEHTVIHKSIAIAALARNCEKNLPRNIKRIEELRQHFATSFVFVYENNSTDCTKEILNHWCMESTNVHIKSENLDLFLINHSPQKNIYKGVGIDRMKRMSECRNHLLCMIKTACTPDYVMFIDSDILSFSVEGIIRAIDKAPSNWGALFANCYMTSTYNQHNKMIPVYYDTFPYIPLNQNLQTIRPFDISLIRRYFVSIRLFKHVQEKEFLQCASAFGGIGIYRFNCIKDLQYQIIRPQRWKNQKMALCEHISMNMAIAVPKYISRDIKVCYADFPCHGIKGWILRHFPTIYVMIGLLHDIFRK